MLNEKRLKTKDAGFCVGELTALIGFLFIIAAVLVFFVDPIERARKHRDDRLDGDAQVVLAALSEFYVSAGRAPWALSVSPKEAFPALSWKSLKQVDVGICADEDCTQAGALVTSGKLPESFLTHESVSGRSGTIYIGKGQGGSASPTYTCFVPESRFYRARSGQLFRINIDQEFPKSGVLGSCPTTVSFVEEDVCYKCVYR